MEEDEAFTEEDESITEEDEAITEEETYDTETNQNTKKNKVVLGNYKPNSKDNFLNVEDLDEEVKKKERSPATCRRLSGRASKYALIQYLSTIAKNKSAIESFDFTFVEYLLHNGADINDCDIIGQSAFHMVAKFWSIDVARFLLDQGADINGQDCLGRSPLHEATALDYAEMVEFLLQNGADLNVETSDQYQKPIHFAAKNDSCQSLNILLAYGADINSLDSKKRTSLQVAAEMNRSNAAELLINEGASAAIYDDDGNSALTLLTEMLPDVALIALNQLYFVDHLTRKEYISLNKLEAPRLKTGVTNAARTPFEIAVQNRRFGIVMHPVVQRLIDVKWENYGKRGAILDLMLNLVYVILWSVLSLVLSYTSHDIYLPIASHGWRLGIVIAIIIITAEEITRHVSDTFRARKQNKEWVELRACALEDDLAYCHPRCPDEWKFLSDEVKSVRNQSYLSTEDNWVYVDWLSLLLVIAAIITHIIFIKHDTMAAYKVHRGVLIALLLVLWIRIAKYARPFESTGPIVVIFAHIMKDIMKCAFLFAILFSPYACAFWVTYGLNSPTPVQGYSNFFDLLYNLLCMVVGIDFPFNDLLHAEPFMARILCSTFIISTAIVVVNVLIALLSDTFTRLYSNAVANAVMQRAQSVLMIERALGKKRRDGYFRFMREYCSPYMVTIDNESGSKNKRENISKMDEITEELKQVKIAMRNLQGKRSSIQPDVGNREDIKTINHTMKQLLKHSRENTDKINKLYSQFMLRKEPEDPVPPSRRHDSILGRKFSVFSTVSENVAIFGCMAHVPSNNFDDHPEVHSNLREGSERDDLNTVVTEACALTPYKTGNLKKSFTPRPGKHPRIRNVDVDNEGFDESEVTDSRPSNWTSHDNSRATHGSRDLALPRNSTSYGFTYPIFNTVPRRASVFLFLDDRASSSTGSLSL